MKLAWRLMLAVGVVLSVAFVLDGYLSLEREETLFAEDMRQDNRLAGNTLSAAITAAREGRIGMLQVSETNERVLIRIVSVGVLPGPRPAAPAHVVRSFVARRGTLEWVDQRHDRLFVYVPVESRPDLAIEISESLAPLRAHRASVLKRTIVRTGATAACVLFLILGLGVAYIGRPVRELVAMARRIGTGDFSARVPVRSSNELGELATAMNVMSENLAEARKKLEAETAKKIAAVEQLRHADRLATVGQLAAGVAHELGTPLTVVAGRAKDIFTGEIQGEEAIESAQIIGQQADRMRDIIRQLLDFSRQRQAQRVIVDLGELVEKVTKLLGGLAREQRVEVQSRVKISAPVKVDSGQLQQALTNLVMNAVQAVGKGGHVTISLEKTRHATPIDQGRIDGDFFRIDVVDDGPGIDPKNLAHVFEPFFTTKDVGEGTGLGLAVAYGLIRENGCYMGATSELGKGACFSIFLPQAEIPDSC